MAAEVKDFNPDLWVDKKTQPRTDPFIMYGIAAADMALEDAYLKDSAFDKNRAGVIMGSGIGGASSIQEGLDAMASRGPKGVSPFFISKCLINMGASMISIRFGFKGPLAAPSVACSTGGNAIGEAFRMIQKDEASVMLAGSSESAILPLIYAGFCATRSMSKRNDDIEHASRPFDKDRDGFVMGEGCGAVVLEELEHAQKRGAKIYAELVGYGNTADAFHFTAPEPNGDGMIRVMQAAFADAGIQPAQVDYINAHGTSTIRNDKTECLAIEKVFGQHAKGLKVSSIKSMIGHLLSAAGSVEFIATVLSVYHGIVPPTINHRQPEQDYPMDFVPQEAQRADITYAISNNFGFGGGNACLAVKKIN
jgi:3-oxoacyl-[acyl-carrier-protein] synthase II